MADNQNNNPQTVASIYTIAGIIISGALYYISNGLNGDFWYLVWLAPLPVLLLALKSSGKAAFTTAFIVCLIGRLSWFSYLVRVATLVPTIIITLLISLAFAGIVCLTRLVVKKGNSWYTAFAFPIFSVLYEFLLNRFSADGTATSIAYSQMNFLPVIQVAAIAGILGITFIVTLVPSTIALGWHYRHEKMKLRYVTIIGGGITVVVLLFGWMRINTNPGGNTIKAGLAVLAEDIHDGSNHPDFNHQKQVVALYAKQITELAAKGAKLVVLPERAVAMDKQSAPAIIDTLSTAAKKGGVFVEIGYTNFRNLPERNSALIISPDGAVIEDYNKTHLVTGFERMFTPGNKLGLFKLNGAQAAVAICKDLDFPSYLKQYGENQPGILCVPAWDFIVDDWLHCRMAILRSVENGFSQVRSARLGRLTINDAYGRVTAEAGCANGKPATLLGNVSTQYIDTLYTRFGDWLGWICAIATLGFAGLAVSKTP